MNAPFAASLLSARRACAARPHPRRHRGLQRRPESAQGQSRRRRLLRRERQGAAARVREARRARADRARPRRAPTCRSTAFRPTTAQCARCCSARDSARHRGGPRGHRAGGRRHRRAQGRRRFPAPLRARRAGLDQRPELGEPSRAVRRRRLHGQHATPTTTPRTHGLDFAGMIAALEQIPAGSDRRAARVLPQPDGRRSDARAMAARSSTSCARAGSCRFSTSPTRASATASMRTAAWCARFAATPGPLLVASSFSKSFSLYGERVGALSVVAADKRRSRARAVAGEADDPRQLLEPADPWRADRRHGAVRRRSCARCGRRSSRAMRDRIKLMRALAGRAAARAGARARTSASSSPSAACSRTPVSPRRRCWRLRDEFSIYAIDTGRICVAALNSRNVEVVAAAIAKVVR